MKKYFLCLMTLCLSTLSFAAVDFSSMMNKVTLQLQAEQWITTKTALLSVAVNASVTDQGIADVQSTILEKLKRISTQGQWRIVSFNRQQDQSGLENIQIVAQARLPQSELAGLRNKAKAISKPGETYTINNVEFTPSDDELRQGMLTLRDSIYQQAKIEIDNLNKIYPNQQYYLYSIDFTQGPISPMPMANTMYMEKASVKGIAAAPFNVGNKTQLQATVIIASIPAVVTQALTHTP